MVKLNASLVAGLLAAAAASQGCGKDSAATVGEQVNQAKDRDRAQAVLNKHEMDPLAGKYTSTQYTPVSDSFTGHFQVLNGRKVQRFDLTAELIVDMEDTGALTPQPVIGGSFEVLDYGRLDETNNRPTEVDLSIANGKYDSTQKSLVLHLNNSATSNQVVTISCKVLSEGRLDCSWRSTIIGLAHFNFLLTRQS